MIPRILVPENVLPASLEEGVQPARRTSTDLDTRQLVPRDLPAVPLEAKSAIPTHIPLDVLTTRTVVPRNLPAAPLEARSAIPAHVPLTVLDSRTVVPKEAAPAVLVPRAPVPASRLPEVLEPDLLTTGEVNLLAKPVDERASAWHWVARAASVLFHFALIAFLFLQPKLFPYRPPTQLELELARRQLAFVYLPPQVDQVPKLPPSRTDSSSPQIRIDPRVLRQIAPPAPEPAPLPAAPERSSPRVLRDLPTAPTPQVPGSDSAERQRRNEPPRETVRLEDPKSLESSGRLLLPPTSPGRALEESIRGAAKGRGGEQGVFSGPVPPNPGGGGSGGQGYLGGNLEILTPTEGVDFTNYLARVLASVKRNWYAVIPESARLGERGKVVIQFRILRDGNVPFPEPALVASSGKEPLDRAAMSAIRTSTPFEPLPPAFSGPFIELRFTFLYNLPIDYQ